MPCRAIAGLLLCALMNGAASAQTIYKCQIDGKVGYTDRPCAGGSPLPVPAAPAPDAHAARELARQKALLATLQKERLAREAREQRDAGQAMRAAQQQQQQQRRCARMRLQKKWADETFRKAAGFDKEALREKARRQSELVALECPY